MTYEEKEINKAEKALFDTMCEVIGFLNLNGMPFDTISEMIDLKKKDALVKVEKALRES